MLSSLVAVVLAGLAPPSQGQVQFPGNNNQQRKFTSLVSLSVTE